MVKKYGKDSPAPERIRALREKAGMTQGEAAAWTMVSLRTWQNWESGAHEMHPIYWEAFRLHVEEMLS